MYVLYYASMLRYWHLIWILVRTDHPYLGVRCHRIVLIFIKCLNHSVHLSLCIASVF
jgi:hypothetical protein